jgi:uncharacterized protein YbjT (DUF2867 family)
MFVIFGGNGKVGRATVQALRARGAAVRVVIRNGAHAEAFRQQGCDVAFADMGDTDALEAALAGADAVQMICPPPSPKEAAPASVMIGYIDAMVKALARSKPRLILAISDYGAHVDAATGIPIIFRGMERKLKALGSPLIVLRSAEHMENWRRAIPAALAEGVLHSMHGAPGRLLPMVSAGDVGAIAADLLYSPGFSQGTCFVHAEGPRRYGTGDVAQALGKSLRRQVVAREVPRGQARHALAAAGIGAGLADLLAQVYEAHHAGHIDVEPGAAIVRRGTTGLDAAISETVRCT